MDLVDQLRSKAKGQCVPMGAHTFSTAADEIDRLRARVAELEAEQIDARKAFESHKRNERHQTYAESAYWCNQYRLLLEKVLHPKPQA